MDFLTKVLKIVTLTTLIVITIFYSIWALVQLVDLEYEQLAMKKQYHFFLKERADNMAVLSSHGLPNCFVCCFCFYANEGSYTYSSTKRYRFTRKNRK